MRTYTIYLNKFLKFIGVLVFWLTIWFIIAKIVGLELLLPSPLVVFDTWIELIKTPLFWISSFVTLLRIVVGFLTAILAGLVLAFATFYFKILDFLVSPVLRVIRATPVASFIILALVWIKTNFLPSSIVFLMVVPLIWQTCYTALLQVDQKLLEMAKTFEFSAYKKLLKIILPSIAPAYVSTCITGLGVAWKSGIAAEIICLPVDSIGRELNNSKIYLETPTLFSWTITILILSIILETVVKFFAKKAGIKQ